MSTNQATIAAIARQGGLGLKRRYSNDVRSITGPRGRQDEAQAIRESFSGFGDTPEGRPSIDYVRAGDVIRVYVAFNPDWYFGGGGIGAAFAQNLSSAFNIVQAPASVGSNAWSVDVQPRSDYSKLQDAVSVVLNAAQRAGLSVSSATSYGQFVSKVETTGGTPTTTIPDPGPGSGSDPLAKVTDFVSKLGQSPTTLAVIVGGIVILVLAAKK